MEQTAILQSREAALALIAARADGATVCPSEVARALASEAGNPSDWRRVMPVVHLAVDQMLGEGLVLSSWKGRDLERRTGPYRLRARRACPL